MCDQQNQYEYHNVCCNNEVGRAVESRVTRHYTPGQEKRFLIGIYHLIGFVHFTYGCYYDYAYILGPCYTNSMRAKLKYLAYWDSMGLSLYFALALINDALFEPSDIRARRINTFKDLLFTTVLFPLSMFVCLSFWGIYIINQRLVLPAVLERCYPCWLIHLMHTNIVFFSLVELGVTCRRYPPRSQGLTWLLGFIGFYYIWIHTYYSCTEAWTHPILRCMNSPKRFVFYLICLALLVGGYFFGEYLNQLFWDKEGRRPECPRDIPCRISKITENIKEDFETNVRLLEDKANITPGKHIDSKPKQPPGTEVPRPCLPNQLPRAGLPKQPPRAPQTYCVPKQPLRAPLEPKAPAKPAEITRLYETAERLPQQHNHAEHIEQTDHVNQEPQQGHCGCRGWTKWGRNE